MNEKQFPWSMDIDCFLQGNQFVISGKVIDASIDMKGNDYYCIMQLFDNQLIYCSISSDMLVMIKENSFLSKFMVYGFLSFNDKLCFNATHILKI